MPQFPQDRELVDQLAGVNRKLRALFDARVKERGLTLARARALFSLSEKEGVNQRDLAADLDIETPTMVRLLDAMEKQGFVERRVETSDRRAKRVHMTTLGRSVADDINALAGQVRQEILRDIDQEKMTIALDVMRAISLNIQAMCGSGKE